jgi:hypothetical protein
MTENRPADGIAGYIVGEIAIQVCACEMAQTVRSRDDSPTAFLEHATRIIMGDVNGGREAVLCADSIQTAWRVYAHLKQLGLLDDRPNKTLEAHANDREHK